MRKTRLGSSILFGLGLSLMATQAYALSARSLYQEQKSKNLTAVDEGQAAGSGQAGGALTIRYALELNRAGEKPQFVGPETVFKTGDRIRVVLEVGRPCNIYVLHKGSVSKKDAPPDLLFPNKFNTTSSVNATAGPVAIPPKGAFQFDANPGKEELVVVVSPAPIKELEEYAAYVIGGGGGPNAAASADLSSQEQSVASQLANRSLGRNLVVEAAQEEGGTVGYAADSNPSSSEPAVLPLALNHQ